MADDWIPARYRGDPPMRAAFVASIDGHFAKLEYETDQLGGIIGYIARRRVAKARQVMSTARDRFLKQEGLIP